MIDKNQDKPLAPDASLLRDLDGAAVWKSLSKLRYFQPSTSSPYRVLLQPKGDKQKINIESRNTDGQCYGVFTTTETTFEQQRVYNV